MGTGQGWTSIENSCSIPKLETIESAINRHKESLKVTPTWLWESASKWMKRGARPASVTLKLELLQHTGSFKPRGALCVLEQLSKEQLTRGVTGVSGGNHALALAYAARKANTSAHVVIPKHVSRIRLQKVAELGAHITLADDIHDAFEKVKDLEQTEGRYCVHPFEGPYTALGTATLGFEFLKQVPNLDVVIVPIGGGGLCAGISLAIKQMKPSCRVIGVEPTGADSMSRSLAAGFPVQLEKVETIADSLGAPYSLPYSFAVCQRFVDEVVTVSDTDLIDAMKLLFTEAKLAAEPAAAAATAALCTHLGKEVNDKNVGVIVCGSNIDIETFTELCAD